MLGATAGNLKWKSESYCHQAFTLLLPSLRSKHAVDCTERWCFAFDNFRYLKQCYLAFCAIIEEYNWKLLLEYSWPAVVVVDIVINLKVLPYLTHHSILWRGYIWLSWLAKVCVTTFQQWLAQVVVCCRHLHFQTHALCMCSHKICTVLKHFFVENILLHKATPHIL